MLQTSVHALEAANLSLSNNIIPRWGPGSSLSFRPFGGVSLVFCSPTLEISLTVNGSLTTYLEMPTTFCAWSITQHCTSHPQAFSNKPTQTSCCHYIYIMCTTSNDSVGRLNNPSSYYPPKWAQMASVHPAICAIYSTLRQWWSISPPDCCEHI